ncbi:MAG: HAD-IA family hydrolase [Patescibacteria group bacterium]|nr:HAD-IA family hydrolase [Patescibacteria group bacterium]
MNKITAIIFDFGDVLVSDTSKEYRKKYSAFWTKKQAAAFEKICRMDDLNQLTISQYCKLLHEQVTPRVSQKEVRKVITGFKLFKNMWGLANRLTKKYQIIIFSNNSKNGPDFIAKKLKINYQKIPFINSSEVGMRKPDLKIYRYALNKFKLKPGETLLVDDKERNLRPARRLGMHTFRYKKNYPELLTFLNKRGIFTK